MVAQFWLEHRPVTPEVASSSLVYPAIKHFSLRSAFRFSAYVGMIREWGRGQLTHYSSNRLNLEAYCGVNIDDKSLVHLEEGVLAVRFKFTRPDIAKSGIKEHGKTP